MAIHDNTTYIYVRVPHHLVTLHGFYVSQFVALPKYAEVLILR